MHLQIIIAFACLLWWPPTSAVASVDSAAATLAFVWGKVVLVALAAWSLSGWTTIRLASKSAPWQRIVGRYHVLSVALRWLILAGLIADLRLTAWPRMLEDLASPRAIPGGAQLVALVPYLLSLVATWWAFFPVEKSIRDSFLHRSTWTRKQFVVFNLRHQFLIIAVPLAVLLVMYVTTREHGRALAEWIGSAWAPDAMFGASVIAVFVFAPVMLRYIWTTTPLADGPLRRKLTALCSRIGLKVRDILVWHSDGVMVNAAVMGLFPRVRYILLSDALLDSMTDEEVEAVFGHEAGHVRYHHMQYFLLFAVASMLVMSGVMELLVRIAAGSAPRWWHTREAIEVIGFLTVIPLWAFGFGYVSRRFERHADTFGAWCAAPNGDNPICPLPCTQHGSQTVDRNGADGVVCAAGATVFVSALRKVASLNGIPPKRRSWRHSSIASRIQFLTALSGDSKMAHGFARRIRTIKRTLLMACAGGLIFAGWYLWTQPNYNREIQRSLIQPIRSAFR